MRVVEGNRMLSVEISRRNLSILEFIPGTSPLKITNFARASKPAGDPAEVARFMRKMADDAGITGNKALVVINEPIIEHRTYVLPKVSKDERDVLVMRKLEGDVSTPLSELSVVSAVLGDTVDRGVDKDEVLVVSTPDFEVKRALYIVMEAGFEPLLMTSFPVACSHLHPSAERDSSISFVLLSEGKSFVTVSRDGKPKFSREFFLDFGSSDVPEDITGYQIIGEAEEDRIQKVIDERIVTELSRSFLYFKQFSRGETLRKVYLMGEYGGEAIRQTVSDRFVMEVDTPETLLTGKIVLVDSAFARGDEFDVSLFAHLIGLATKAKETGEINLLPQEYLERKKKIVKRTVATGAAALYLLANVILIFGFSSAKSHYQSLLREFDDINPVIVKNREFTERIHALKRKAAESEAILRQLEHPFTRWVECFGLLSQAAPKTVTFDDLSIQKEVNGYQWKLSGRTEGRTPEEVQLEFNRFFSSVKNNPFLDGTRYIPVVVYPVEGHGHQYEEKFILELSMKGDLGE